MLFKKNNCPSKVACSDPNLCLSLQRERFYFLEPRNHSSVFYERENKILGDKNNNFWKATQDMYTKDADNKFIMIGLYNL